MSSESNKIFVNDKLAYESSAGRFYESADAHDCSVLTKSSPLLVPENPPTMLSQESATSQYGVFDKEKIIYDPETGRFYENTFAEIESAGEALDTIRIVIDRLFDTVDDAWLHYRRKFTSKGARTNLQAKKEDIPRVVVLGYGWAGHAISKIIDTDKVDVVFVSPRNYFVFTPMLASSSVGTVEYRSITEPVRKANPVAEYYEGSCIDVFPDRKEILIESVESPVGGQKQQLMIPYDYLVWAVGVETGTFGIPGVLEYCCVLKEVDDAIKLRKTIINTFEKASLPYNSEEEIRRLLTFVVIGAGPTGVEFSGEFTDLLKNDLPQYYPTLVGKTTLKIIQAGGALLPMFDEEMQNTAFNSLTSSSFVEVMLNTKVKEIQEKKIILGDGKEFEYGVAVWAAGTQPREITRKLISKVDAQANAPETKRGSLLVDAYLRVAGTNGTILALGDATVLSDGPLPATGQVAAQQGAFLARVLNRGYDLTMDVPTVALKNRSSELESILDFIALRGNMKAKPFEFLNLGLLAYVGGSKALAQVQVGDSTWVKASGKVGFFLWRSVYVVKQVSTRNRILVLFDRIKSLVFGRDITRL